MIKIAYVDTDQYQIDDNVVALSRESISSLLEHFNVSGSINELLDNLKTSGTISLEEKNEIKEVEGSLDKESWEPEKIVLTDKQKLQIGNGLIEEEREDNDNRKAMGMPSEKYEFERLILRSKIPQQYLKDDYKVYFIVRRIPIENRYSFFEDLYALRTDGTIENLESSFDTDALKRESSQKYSFRTTDENGVVHYYKIVKNRVISIKNL